MWGHVCGAKWLTDGVTEQTRSFKILHFQWRLLRGRSKDQERNAMPLNVNIICSVFVSEVSGGSSSVMFLEMAQIDKTWLPFVGRFGNFLQFCWLYRLVQKTLKSAFASAACATHLSYIYIAFNYKKYLCLVFTRFVSDFVEFGLY